MADEWKKLHRELKILRAKQKAGGWLHPKDAERLAFLEERLGDAPEVERIQVSEPVDAGPKTLTSDDHYATEVSEKLLDDAKEYQPQKYYEKELAEHPKTTFEAHDIREGKATFKQEGLSSFAIEATEDMRDGEIGLQDAPEEEEVAASKIDHHQAVYAKDETERLTKKPSKGSSNPFALEISDSLASSLEAHQDPHDSSVPDTAAMVHEVDYPEEEKKREISEVASVEMIKSEAQTKNVGVPVDLEGELTKMSYPESAVPDLGETEDSKPLLRKSYDLPVDRIDHGEVREQAKAQGVDSTVHGGLSYDLMRQALEAASEEDLLSDADFVEVPDEPEKQSAPEIPASTTADTAVFQDPTYQEETAAIDQPDFSHIPEEQPQPADDLAVLVPDPPPESPAKSGDELYGDDEPTGPEVATPDPDLDAPGSGELPMPPPPPNQPAADVQEVDDPLLAEAQELIQAAERAVDEGSDAGVAIEVDLEDSRPAAADQAADPQADLGADIDEFWGTSTNESTREGPALKAADVAEPLGPSESDDLFDLDMPAEPEQGSVTQEAPTTKQAPLPPLSIPKTPETAGKRAKTTSEKDFINALFSDSEIDSGQDEDGLVPAPARPEPAAPKPTTGPIPGLAPVGATARKEVRKPGGSLNDLKGPRKATVHYKDGVTRRGVLGQVDTNADTIRLDPPSGSSAPSENLVALSLKTIFLMLPRGTPFPNVEGPPVRMVLIDGRSLEGNTPDYDPQRKAFTLFPKSSRGNIERIIVFNDAIKNIWFEEV